MRCVFRTGTSSWKEQFTEAWTVSGDGGGDEQDGEGGTGQGSPPSTMDYFMHSLTIFWKVLFAFVPPTGIVHFFFIVRFYKITTFSKSTCLNSKGE